MFSILVWITRSDTDVTPGVHVAAVVDAVGLGAEPPASVRSNSALTTCDCVWGW